MRLVWLPLCCRWGLRRGEDEQIPRVTQLGGGRTMSKPRQEASESLLLLTTLCFLSCKRKEILPGRDAHKTKRHTAHRAAKSIRRKFQASCTRTTGQGEVSDQTQPGGRRGEQPAAHAAFWSNARNFLSEKCLFSPYVGVEDSSPGQCHMCKAKIVVKKSQLKRWEKRQASHSKPEARWKWHNVPL